MKFEGRSFFESPTPGENNAALSHVEWGMHRSLTKDIAQGGIAFATVGVAAFSVWAFAATWFRQWGGELAMYSTIALVFLVGSGLLMGALAGGMGKFYCRFLPAFFAYAVLWCAAWFSIGGRLGEWVGAAAGCLIFTILLLGKKPPHLLLRSALMLFALHTIGYFAGDAAMYDLWVPRAKSPETTFEERKLYLVLAKLSWGLCYGFGFGAGIGWLFHEARKSSTPRTEA